MWSANIRELDLGAFVGHDPNTAGKLIYKAGSIHSSAEIDSAPQDVVYQFLAQPLNLYKSISIPAGGYRFTSHSLAYTSSGSHKVTFTASEQWGGYYTGHLNAATLLAQFRPNPHLAVALSGTLSAFRREISPLI